MSIIPHDIGQILTFIHFDRKEINAKPLKKILTTQILITLDGEEASLMERLAKALSTSTLEMEEFLERNHDAQEMPQLENQVTINRGSSLVALRLTSIVPFLVFQSLTPQSIKLICFGPSSTRKYYTVVIDSFFWDDRSDNNQLMNVSNQQSFCLHHIYTACTNSGIIMGTHTQFKTWTTYDNYDGPVRTYKYKLYDADMNLLEGALNDLVKEELGDVGYSKRGDARLFTYPDGQAGAFIERTGVFYKLTEIAMLKL